MPSLTRAEALTRAALLAVDAVEVDLDLDRGPEVFGSRTTLRFTCRTPGSATFVEVRPRELHAVTLNGRAIDPASLVDGRLDLTDLEADNVLEVEATMAYSHDGQGLHRSTDPADGEDYVYGHLFLDAAPTVFACFDQPDLKAPYTVAVTAPQEWTVLGNGGATLVAPGRTELAPTPPLATYFVTVCAGPWASVRAEHDGIPLGVHTRRSLEPHLREQAEHVLETTRACFDYYHRLFGIRYPFGEYHQVFVPEFNAGAMENPGCVTFRDTMIFRGASTPDQVLQRSNTIAHEMAHMWFGDLVTMTWWDDLWLNESFAEYMAYRTVCEVTEFTDAWVEFGVIRKLWGYAAERAPSTHPVAGSPAPDALSALGNFDGISYAKGASVIRQLIAHIGDEAFVAGVAEHLRTHQFGNGDLAQFLAAMESASGRSLAGWSAAWLETAGADRLALHDGVLTRTPPAAHPADRPHTLDVAAFAGGREVARVEVVVEGERTPVPGLSDLPAGALVVPNAGDLTWAEVSLDPQTVAALPSRLPDVPDEQARAVLWVALLGAVSRGEVDPRAAVDVFAAAWPRETSAAVLSRTALVTDGAGRADVPPAAGAGARAGTGRRRGRRPPRPLRRRRGSGRRRARRGRRPGLGRERHRHGAAAALGGRRRHPRCAARGRRLPVGRAAAVGLAGCVERERDRACRGRGPLPGGLAGGPGRAGRAADRRGQGVGVGSAARRPPPVELRGPGARGRLLGHARPRARAAVGRPGGRPRRGAVGADG